MPLKESYDVLVVGGGPVGLFLAAELRRADVRVGVVERAPEPVRQIKAGSIGPSSAELFDQRGLADHFPQPDFSRFLAAGDPDAPPPPVGHFSGLWLLRGSDDIRTAPLVAAQYDVEVVLDAYATALGAHIARGHTVTAVVDDGDTVRVTVDHDGAVSEVTAAFVVGCDGGRSTVRRLAGFAFDGTPGTVTGRQALVEIAEPGPLQKGWHRTDHGMVVFGPDPRRVLTVEFDGPPTDRESPLDRAEMEASLRRVSGTDVTVTALLTGTRWTDNTRRAGGYRRGRVLLAGDAAHVHPPFGGQGLDLGFQDAANLGWKLAATVAGHAPDGLLDTYDDERAPVAARVLENTRAQVALMRPDPQTAALRALFADLLGYDDANTHVSSMMFGVDRYPAVSDHPQAGRIVADRPVGERRLYEVLRTPGALLLDATPDGAAAAAAAGWADRVRVERGPETLLIRPDGVVAWGAADDTGPLDAGGLEKALTHWFGPPASAGGH
ncbi:FAD-dependent oxidoreductase [Pseudonocardia sulfidoxydans NBRC 16205]|uniref:FAD-dependent oxidoreductase n=1 Tax=Pseudonocardia sulfidoxydans NBRC 16205 TaxID=1223511 RepID=A0A511DFY9_9PSEU|nr:FAD-dependent monooxygenase [Pseudonocardia sulfidoxydans]GEL21908.1 FAD-dependent oxidoreductase [Pseudonocardia sulfidoxydans NBRC 16205]